MLNACAKPLDKSVHYSEACRSSTAIKPSAYAKAEELIRPNRFGIKGFRSTTYNTKYTRNCGNVLVVLLKYDDVWYENATPYDVEEISRSFARGGEYGGFFFRQPVIDRNTNTWTFEDVPQRHDSFKVTSSDVDFERGGVKAIIKIAADKTASAPQWVYYKTTDEGSIKTLQYALANDNNGVVLQITLDDNNSTWQIQGNK